MGEHFTQLGEGEAPPPKEAAPGLYEAPAAPLDPAVSKVIGDKALVELLFDPIVKTALEACKADPGALPRLLRESPGLGAKFGLLAKAGLVRFE